jgi:hypothetical protein
VETGHEDKIYSGSVSPQLWADRDNFAQRRTNGQIFFGLAMNFTGTAADASFLVLIYVVAAHRDRSFFVSVLAFVTRTIQSATGQLPPTETVSSPFMKVLSRIPFRYALVWSGTSRP